MPKEHSHRLIVASKIRTKACAKAVLENITGRQGLIVGKNILNLSFSITNTKRDRFFKTPLDY